MLFFLMACGPQKKIDTPPPRAGGYVQSEFALIRSTAKAYNAPSDTALDFPMAYYFEEEVLLRVQEEAADFLALELPRKNPVPYSQMRHYRFADFEPTVFVDKTELLWVLKKPYTWID